jgi:predicted TIM-barrel fold metal-dependent hydrolase
MMYFDTVSYHASAIRCAAETIGADRLLFGTGSPMLLSLKQQGIDVMEAAGFSKPEKEAVPGGRAQKLLRL